MKTSTPVACVALSWLSLSLCFAGQTVFDAAREGDMQGVREMLAEDPALVAARSDTRKTPLHLASEGGYLEIVELLIAEGAPVNAANAIGETPLHYAVAMGHAKVTAALLAHDADLAVVNIDENTPLHYAAFGGQTDTARLLLEKGADVNAVNHYGYTPRDLADTLHHEELGRLFASAGGRLIPITDPEVVHLSGRIDRILFPFGDVSNIAVSSGDDGFLLVDTGFTPRAVESLGQVLHRLGEGHVEYVINTHLHRDHVAGNGIGDGEAITIDYNTLDQRVSEGVLSLAGKPVGDGSARGFDAYYALDFNGEEVRLFPYAGIHTDADVIVHFTRSGVVHMGDLLISQSFPSITRKVDEYLELLHEVTDVFPAETTFVCGHGREMTPADVEEYRDMLARAAAIVRAQMKEGKDQREVNEQGALDTFARWGTFIPILNADYWIAAVFNSSSSSVSPH